MKPEDDRGQFAYRSNANQSEEGSPMLVCVLSVFVVQFGNGAF